MFFESKKISSETLGEYLIVIRTSLGLTQEQVVLRSGICTKYINALETGNYSQLPPTVYVIGFLKQLAEVYNVSFDSLLSQFKKERGIADQVASSPKKSQSRLKQFFSTITVTPKSLVVAVAFLFVTSTISYLVYQVVVLNQPPLLEVYEPATDQVVRGGFVTVSGRTNSGSLIKIDGQTIFVESNGKFKTTLGAASGQKELLIEATNKFEKRTTKVVSLMVSSDSTTEAVDPVQLELSFIRPAVISISVDGQQLPQERVAAGSIKSVKASKSILLSTTDGGAVTAKLNQTMLGSLGRDGEVLVNIPFSVETTAVLSSQKSFQN
jgi:cytoskeletal protein RodZ